MAKYWLIFARERAYLGLQWGVKKGGGGFFGTKPRPENYDFQGGFSTQRTLDCQKNVNGPNPVYAPVGEDGYY